MEQIKIKLQSVQDIQDFVSLATAQPFPVRVGCGDHWVNGKSFMEMFGLNFSRPLSAALECGEAERAAFLQEARRFCI